MSCSFHCMDLIGLTYPYDVLSLAPHACRQEVEIQRKLCHNNIVAFRGACCEYINPEEESGNLGRSGFLTSRSSQGVSNQFVIIYICTYMESHGMGDGEAEWSFTQLVSSIYWLPRPFSQLDHHVCVVPHPTRMQSWPS